MTAATVVVLAGCGGGGATRLLTAEGLADAATTSADAGTGRFVFEMSMTAPDGYDTIAFSGYGSFDTEAGRTAVNLDMSAMASFFEGLATAAGGNAPALSRPELWKLDAVQDRFVMYMRFPVLSRVPGVLPRGKTWVKIDLRRAAREKGFDVTQLQQLASNDPRDALRCLEAVASELQVVGEEELHGVETTHYRTSIDLLKYAQLAPPSTRKQIGSMLDELVRQSGLRTIPVDVWVDESSLVYRLTMTFSALPPGAAQSFDASIRFELYDYGEPVAIELPSAATTVDALTLRG